MLFMNYAIQMLHMKEQRKYYFIRLAQLIVSVSKSLIKANAQ